MEISVADSLMFITPLKTKDNMKRIHAKMKLSVTHLFKFMEIYVMP
jgi:hypothetical protein